MLIVRLIKNTEVTVLGKKLTVRDKTVSCDVAALLNHLNIDRLGEEAGSSDFTDLCLLLDRKVVVANLGTQVISSSDDLRALASPTNQGGTVTASNVTYNDTQSPPATGMTNGQDILDYLKGHIGPASQHLTIPFDVTDVGGGSKLIGVVPGAAMVQQVLLTIAVEFDDPDISIEVGTAADHAELMEAADNAPTVEGKYAAFNDKQYLADTAVSIYFEGGSPTIGSGHVSVFLA